MGKHKQRVNIKAKNINAWGEEQNIKVSKKRKVVKTKTIRRDGILSQFFKTLQALRNNWLVFF